MNNSANPTLREQFAPVEQAISRFCLRCLADGAKGGLVDLKVDLSIGGNSQYVKLITALNRQDATEVKRLIVSAFKNSFICSERKCQINLRPLVKSNHTYASEIEAEIIKFSSKFNIDIAISNWWKPSQSQTNTSHPGQSSSPLPPATEWALAATYLQRGVTTVAKGPASENAKEKLYGGDPHLLLSPLELVALDHNFSREDATNLVASIATAEEKCTSISFTAAHGTGLSLALAQLVKEVCANENSQALSIIGDANKTTKFLESLNRDEALRFSEWAKSLPPHTTSLTLVIDDVSETSQDGWRSLYGFISECENQFVDSDFPNLTFVLGWFGTAPKLSENVTHLRLTDHDVEACYQKMATGDFPILEVAANGHADILRNPRSVRALGDDAQALIDFLIEHGKATRSLKEHWLAGTDHIRSGRSDPLTLTAAAQALDLSIPEGIAIRLFTERGKGATVKAIAEANKRLTSTHSNDFGEGVGLSCPRRANSILSRVKRENRKRAQDWFDSDCIERDFCVLIIAALASYEETEPHSDISLNFARHIFQRLGKKEFLPLVGEAGKGVIGDRLAITFQTWIIRLSDRWNVPTKIKWASTMSAFLRKSRTVSDGDREWQRKWASFVTKICNEVTTSLSNGSCDKTPSLMLGLMRAVRRLNITKYFEAAAITLMGEARALVTPDALCELIELQLECTSEDSVYRANELLHQWCKFEESYASPSQCEAGCRDISATLERIRALFENRQVQFDPASLIEFSRYIWDKDPDNDLRQTAIRQKLDYLDRAEAAMIENPRKFASWDAKLQAEKAKLKVPQMKVREMNEHE